jgi:predicted ATPase/DNA-binding SARP family transcriptional activator
MSAGIEIRLLGQLQVAEVEFEGAKQRRLFVALALRAPEAVSVDELVQAVWGDEAPDGRDQALQKQVSRLRARLGDRLPVRRRAAGYALEIEREAIDSHRFEALVADGEFEAALALWRGPALAEHRFDQFAQSEIARLEELRLEAIEERMGAELARGHAVDLVGELRALVAEHPLRERLRGSLMLALYRAGRQADALEAMRDGRRLLVEELGLEPGPELRRLETMILAHDPELNAEDSSDVLLAPLPTVANATIGREGELAEIDGLLVKPEVRLLTLVGTGGVGKTRLALEAGRTLAGRFAGGVAYVDLTSVDDAGAVVPEAASALGVVADTPAELGERLARATRGASALLVLDGFERFQAEAAQVTQLLAAAPNLTVLVTSRAPLRLTAEHAYRVQPLAISNAAALFKARVAAARPDWTPSDDDHVVTEICSRLDGLPLAIELAADRARLLPLPALLERLDRRLELLSCGPHDLPERQRSLRATLEWSWEALDPAQRRLLARLCVFEGGASLEAFDAVCNLEGGPAEAVLAMIMNKTSLVVVEAGADGQPRLTMLGTVHDFALEQIERFEQAALEQEHALYFLEYAERAADQAAHADRRLWLARLAAERGNLRVAYERLLRAGAGEDALRIAIAFARALPWDAHAHEVRGWLQQALSKLPPRPTPLRAAALYWDGQLAISQARFAAAKPPLEHGLSAARALKDRELEAAVLTALCRRAVMIADASAVRLAESAIAVARGVGEPGVVADAVLTAAGAYERAEDWQRAAELADEALALYRDADDPYGVAGALGEQGFYDIVHGRLERAERRLSEAVELRRHLGDDRRLVEPLIDNAWLDLARGSGEAARRGFLDCLALALHVGDQFNVAEALAGLSTQAALDGQHLDAARQAGASAAIHERIGAPPWGALHAIHESALTAARGALGEEAFAALLDEGRRLSASEAVARSRRFARAAGTPEVAADVVRQP